MADRPATYCTFFASCPHNGSVIFCKMSGGNNMNVRNGPPWSHYAGAATVDIYALCDISYALAKRTHNQDGTFAISQQMPSNIHPAAMPAVPGAHVRYWS